MATYNNPKGSPDVQFTGPVTYTQADLADICRSYATQLKTPEAIDAARLLWAIAGKESSFGADCRPRHEDGYCLGKYSPALRNETKEFGHAAHCSFGPWQVLWCNVTRAISPDVYFGTLKDCAISTVDFLNREILGRQHATTIEQIADAYNSGNFRDRNVPADYIAGVLHNYSSVPMPPARTITLHASGTQDDASTLYGDLCGAIEGLGAGFHPGALAGVPVDVQFAGVTRSYVGCDIEWFSDEHGKRIDRITLKAI